MTAVPNADVAAATAHLVAENAYLRERLADVTAERDRAAAQLVAAEEYGANLVKLYVSNRRLNEAVDRRDALAAIHEIIVSVVGCEEFAIVERDPHTSRTSLASSFGIDDATLGSAAAASDVTRSVVDTGRAYYAPEPAAPARAAAGADAAAGLTACVPLVERSGRVVGAIALYGLLPHRGRLDHNDRTLLELISLEAARALVERGPAAAA